MKNILIVGTNDRASACAIRLYRAGFGICMAGLQISFDLFSFRNFSSTLKQGSKSIENIKALSFADFLFNSSKALDLSIDQFINFTIKNRQITVLNENDLNAVDFSKFDFCINCEDTLFKNISPKLSIPIISCGSEKYNRADYFVGTKNNFLGRVKYSFLEHEENIEVEQKFVSILSPAEGIFITEKWPGDRVHENERIGTVANEEVIAVSNGFISGVISSGIIVHKNLEIFRYISAAIKEDISELSYKDFSIAGGVLEAILFHLQLNK